jgi:hypothetical protein
MMRWYFNIPTISEIWILLFYIDFVYPSGKAMIPHLRRCHEFAVVHYGFTRDALNMGHPCLSLN